MVLSKRRCLLCGFDENPLFRFPKNPTRFSKWLKAINREDLLDEYSVQYIHNNGKLCGSHFHESAFTSTLKTRLSFCSIPIAVAEPQSVSLLQNCSYRSSLPLTAAVQSPTGISTSPTPHASTQDPMSSFLTTPPAFQFNSTPIQSSKTAHLTLPMTPTIIQDSTTSILKSPTTASSRVQDSDILTSWTPSITPKTRRIKKLTTKVAGLQRKLFNVKNSGILSKLKSMLTSIQYDFVLSQVRAANSKGPQGRRWTAKDKTMALNIYLQSSSAYSILSKYLPFPSKSTLRRCTGQIAKNTGFCPVLQAALKEKAKKMTPSNKLCTLVFDEMSVKSVIRYNPSIDAVDGFESLVREDGSSYRASQALVFMIRGIEKNWKQVVAYYFRSNLSPGKWFKNTLLSVIDKVDACGFTVVATVCDQGPVNQTLYYTNLGVSPDKPYFEYRHSKIFTLFDVPHLFKNVRNNLMNYNIHFTESKDAVKTEKVARWKYIVDFYNHDSSEALNIARKLTSKHIYPTRLDKMRVNLAVQVLSHTVASGISILAKTGVLPSEACFTAQFLGLIDELFDSLNSSSRLSKHPYAGAVTNDSDHINLWARSLVWISSWKFMDSDGKRMTPPCQKGLLLTISAMIGLWELHSPSLNLLMTRRLNQDCLENTFSSVRKRGGFRDHPDCYEFRSAIRGVMITNFIRKSSLANCKDDQSHNLLELGKIPTSLISTCFEEEEEGELVIDLSDEEVPTLSHIESNVIAYIAGFLARSYLKKTPCEECRSFLVGPKDLDTHTFLLYFKDYEETNDLRGLKWPTHHFYEFVKKAAEIFLYNIGNFFHKPCVSKRMYDIINISPDFFNDHHHKELAAKFILQKLIIMLIKHKVKVLNKNAIKCKKEVKPSKKARRVYK